VRFRLSSPTRLFSTIGGLSSGLALLIVGAAAGVVGGVSIASRWREEHETPFSLGLDDEKCLQIRGTPYNDMQVRVKVTNTRSFGLTDVRARMYARVPDGHEYYLRQIHDDTGDLSLHGDYLRPKGNLFVDVAHVTLGEPRFVFDFATEKLRSLEETDHPEHVFTIEVHGRHEETGRAVKAGRRRFRLIFTPDSSQPLVLTEAP